MSDDSFFKLYFNEYIGIHDNTESPITFHRWSVISLIAVLLGRRFLYPCGLGNRIPNQYIQFIGVPASRKSTPIKQANKLLRLYGFKNFAPKKTSPGRYLMDLHELTWGKEGSEQDEATLIEHNLFGTDDPREQAADMPAAESYISNDEFNTFIGTGNLDFIALLGDMWDFEGVWDYSLKHSEPVYINNPTINILSANTPTGLFDAFPPGVLDGQGFFSRLLLIFGAPTGKKVHPVRPPSDEGITECFAWMKRIQESCIGVATVSPTAFKLLDTIYRSPYEINDPRFTNYMGRRFTNLEKLCLITAASRCSNVIDEQDVILANTILTAAERNMPKARGEFGRSRNSIVTQKILDFVYDSKHPLKITDIMKIVYNDVDNLKVIHDVIRHLIQAGKVQIVDGFICPVYALEDGDDNKYIDNSLLEAGENQ